MVGRVEIRRAIVQLEPRWRYGDDDFLAVDLGADGGQILEYDQAGRPAAADWEDRKTRRIVLEQVARVVAVRLLQLRAAVDNQQIGLAERLGLKLGALILQLEHHRRERVDIATFEPAHVPRGTGQTASK